MQRPDLRKSDLLYTFLTSRDEFSESAAPKLFSGVAGIKLTKERGQFLQVATFIVYIVNIMIIVTILLQSFLHLYRGSTQNPPARPGQLVEVVSPLLPRTAVWAEQLQLGGGGGGGQLGPASSCAVSGLYELLLHSMTRLLAPHCRAWLRLGSALRWLAGDCFNALVHHLVAAKLDTLLTSGRVAHLITVIEVTRTPDNMIISVNNCCVSLRRLCLTPRPLAPRLSRS